MKKRLTEISMAASVPVFGTLTLLLVAKSLTPHDFAIYSAIATSQILVTVLGGPVLFNLVDISLLESYTTHTLRRVTAQIIRIAVGVTLAFGVLALLTPMGVGFGAVALVISGITRTLAEYISTHLGVSGHRDRELRFRAMPSALTVLIMLSMYPVLSRLDLALLAVAASQAVSSMLIVIRVGEVGGKVSLCDLRIAMETYLRKLSGLRLNLISVFVFAVPLIVFTVENKGSKSLPVVAFAMQMLNSGSAFYALLMSSQLRKTALRLLQNERLQADATSFIRPMLSCVPIAIMMAGVVNVYLRFKNIDSTSVVSVAIFLLFLIELYQSFWTGVTFRGNFRNIEKCATVAAIANVASALFLSSATAFLLGLAAAQFFCFLVPHIVSYGMRNTVSRLA